MKNKFITKITTKIRVFFYRISGAIKFGWWYYKNPQTVSASNFKMLSDLLNLILKVASEDRHRMTQIAYIHPETGKDESIVSIWAGAGAAADPLKRITELLEENSRMKILLSKRLDESNNNANPNP